MKLKILELFGGIGSPRKALENLGFDLKSIDYVEWWDWAVKAYNKLFDHKHKPQDIKTWNLNVNILIHGSPCQDFSQAGKNDILSGRSILYRRTLEIINELVPLAEVIIFENVKGMLNKRNNPHFQHYCKELEKLGYVNKYKVLNSLDFGIPQSRNRVFVVSIHKTSLHKYGHFNFDNLELKKYEPLKTFLEKEVDKSYFIKSKSMISAVLNEKVKIIGENTFTITTKENRWNNGGVLPIYIGFTNFNAENKVHNIDGYSSTITAGGAQSRIKVAIPIDKPIEGIPIFKIGDNYYHLRLLTERERWRLMGWEDIDIDKVIDMPKTHLGHMAGNAIVIQVLESIFKELLKYAIH